jgi:LacI family transcriptional regulator
VIVYSAMKRQRPTIFDLERITGFSTGTISRAFNQSNRINAQTRELILRKAREVGYAPHSGARSLIQGRTGRFGLLLPDLGNPRYSEIMDSLDLVARQHSSLLLLGLSRYDAAIETELAFHWASGETDGIIANASSNFEPFEQLRNRKFPIVFLFGRPSDQFDFVTVDTQKCCAELLERCIKLGHRRIGYVSPEFQDSRIFSSFVTYKKVLKAHGLPVEEANQFFGTHDYTAGAEAWTHWKNNPKRPTSVLCFNDAVACGLIQAANSSGCRIPEDLSVIGSDDIPVASFYNLTTMRNDPAQIAAEAFSLLTRQRTRSAEDRVVPTTIVERNSIAAPPKKVK